MAVIDYLDLKDPEILPEEGEPPPPRPKRRNDPQFEATLDYLAGQPGDILPGADEQKIERLLKSKGKQMLPYSYEKETPFSRSVKQPPAPDYLSERQPEGSLQFPQVDILPRMEPFTTMPVMGGPVGSGMVTEADILPLPHSKEEALLLGASLLPIGKLARPAARAGRAIARGVQEVAPIIGGPQRRSLFELAQHTRGQTGKELRAAQQALLSPEALEQIEDVSARSPEFRQARNYLTPQEAEKVISSPESIEAFERLLRELPSVAHMEALAKAGEVKRGWYRGSSQAILDIFGVEDAPRFASLLAAMSPQTSVENNLQNALNVWKNWTAAGRPVDPRQIRAVMGASVQGTKGEQSILPVWINNSMTALTTVDPRTITLSGPKVDSFYLNLLDDVQRVTNDAWLANAFGVSQDLFGGTPTAGQRMSGDPGLSPGYIGTSARLRQGAERAGMFPREGQETIWSVAKPLMEQASKKGMDPRDFLQRGMLTPELIRGTPDFSTLLKDPQYRRILEQAGYGEQLGKMKPFEFPVSSTSLTLPEQRYLEKTAGTLGELQKLRGREAGAKSVTFPTEGYRPEKVYPTEQSEQITGRVTGHLPGLVDAPQSTRNYYSPRAAKAFQDLQGRDVLHEAVNLPTLEGRPATGAYQPETGPPEINLVRALPVESEVVRRAGGRPGIPKETQRKLTGVAAVRGPMLAQAAQTWNVGIPWDQGVSLRLPRLDRAPVELMEAAMKKYPKLIFADTGLGVNVINFGELFPPELVLDLQRTFRSGPPIPTHNVSAYIDFADAWSQKPGSGSVTRQMFSEIEQMTPQDQRALDRAVREPAGKMEQFYMQQQGTRKEPVREDLMNLLRIMRDQGLVGAKQALQSGAFLPGLVGALVLPAILDMSRQEQEPVSWLPQ